MRYAIFSDVHSNLEALEAVVSAYKKERIDEYYCGGDIVGYATNPAECMEIVQALVRQTVAGNHDWASVDLFSLEYFNSMAKEAIAWTGKRLDANHRHFLESLKLVYKNDFFTLVHGTLHEPRDFNYMFSDSDASMTFELMDTDVCFVGHSHIAGFFAYDRVAGITYSEAGSADIKSGNKYIVNVGSVGQPRDQDPRSAYCVYDTDKKKITIKRIGYDIGSAAGKIIDAGLPRFLAERLSAGK